MTYSLIAIFLASGRTYVEQRHLSLAACAGRLAMLRTATIEVVKKIEPRVGKIQYRCVPEGRQ